MADIGRLTAAAGSPDFGTFSHNLNVFLVEGYCKKKFYVQF